MFQGYACGIHSTRRRDRGTVETVVFWDGEERLRLHQRSLPHCAGAVFGSSSSQNRVMHRFSVLPGLTSSSPSKQKASRVNRLHCAIFRGRSGPLSGLGSDPRFQRLDPLLATPGVNVLSRLAEQIAPQFPSPRVSHPAGRCCATVRIKRLPRIAPVYLQHITRSLVLCPSLWDKTRDKTPFVPPRRKWRNP